MNIFRLREKAGMTQEQFWQRIGLTQSCGSRYEKGKRPLPEPISLLLAITYGTFKESQSTVNTLRK